MGVVRNLLILVYYFILAGSLLSAPILAVDEFSVSQQLFYDLDRSGNAEVTHDIELTNLLSHVYAKEYSLKLETARLFSPSAVTADGVPLPITVSRSGSTTALRLVFPDPVVGRGKTNHFKLFYRLENLVRESGLVREVNFPKVAGLDSHEDFSLTLSVPESLGNLSFVSPRPDREEKQADKRFLYFTRDRLAASSLSLVLGDIQIFNFALSYYLENPDVEPAVLSIALPPDTDRQTVYFQNIFPRPRQVTVDPDGNWLAEYELAGNRELEISVTGNVKIFPGQNPLRPKSSESPEDFYLHPQPYWPVDNPDIVQEASRLSGVEDIYRFVVSRLEYNNRLETNGRLGAVEALRRPTESTCTEFTDLFITLCRAKGIPAREINGYAYSADSRFLPLSQTLDVLHSWPEYWNDTLKYWQPVDPTWEKTTGGLDYFHKFDLNHFAFAIHGQSDTLPLPAGAYTSASDISKGVQVIFGSAADEPVADFELDIILADSVFPSRRQGMVKVTNLTGAAYYDLPVSVSASRGSIIQNPSDKINLLPPFASVTLPFSYRSELLGFGKGEIAATVGLDSVAIPLSPFSQGRLLIPAIVFIASTLTIGLKMLTIALRKYRRS